MRISLGPIYKASIKILFFSLLLSCSENSEFKTPALTNGILQDIILDFSQDRNKYLDTLQKYTGISQAEGRRIFKYVSMARTTTNIKDDVVLDILLSIEDLKNKKPKEKTSYFIANVLWPYLLFTANQNSLVKIHEDLIYASFLSVFKLSENENYLRSLVNTTEDYYNNKAYNVDSLNLFNNVLSDHGYFLDYNTDPSRACIYKIEDKLIDKSQWKNKAFTVVMVNRFTPCFLSHRLGYATVNSNIVIVIGYAVENYIEKLILELESGKRSSFYMDFSYEKIWKAIGLDLSLARANELIYKLIEIDLKGKTQQEIYANQIAQTAIHEAKHFTDRMDRPEQIVNYDREVSAHLTELLHGNTPFLSLRSVISRTEGFYFASGDQKMGLLLKTLWELVFTLEQNNYDKDFLLTQIHQIYNNYESYYENQSLPELQSFRTKISQPILVKLRKNGSLAKSF